MKNVLLLSLLLVCSMEATAQRSGQPDSKKAPPPREMCAAAAPKLRQAGTNDVVLAMMLDASGKVQSFKTESPTGLRLEKMKEPAAAIKAMQFKPARKDGRPVRVMVRVQFDCSEPATNAEKKP